MGKYFSWRLVSDGTSLRPSRSGTAYSHSHRDASYSNIEYKNQTVEMLSLMYVFLGENRIRNCGVALKLNDAHPHCFRIRKGTMLVTNLRGCLLGTLQSGALIGSQIV